MDLKFVYDRSSDAAISSNFGKIWFPIRSTSAIPQIWFCPSASMFSLKNSSSRSMELSLLASVVGESASPGIPLHSSRLNNFDIVLRDVLIQMITDRVSPRWPVSRTVVQCLVLEITRRSVDRMSGTVILDCGWITWPLFA
jgi:hypothetical protein